MHRLGSRFDRRDKALKDQSAGLHIALLGSSEHLLGNCVSTLGKSSAKLLCLPGTSPWIA
ncbi:hypothetical protein EMIT0196P_80037 [Pseudomonas chlororaphis]